MAELWYCQCFLVSVCPPIDHCNARRCTAPGDNICVYCDGEVAEQDYYRAYTPVPSGKTKCESKKTHENTQFQNTFFNPHLEIVYTGICIYTGMYLMNIQIKK